jgi:Uma2 family endonuclease
VPDLVEMLSPSDRDRNMQAKVAMYQEAGVPLLWVADPQARTVTVRTPGEAARTLTVADTLDGGAVLPGFQNAIADLFA